MADRMSVLEQVQIGPENTAGTQGTADTRLRSIMIEPGIKQALQVYKAVGGKFTFATVQGKEHTEAKISGFADYNELAYLFCGVLGTASPSAAGTSASATTNAWAYIPNHNTADTPQTYTVELGSAVRAERILYGLITEFSISFDREKVEIGGKLVGQAVSDGISLTASPTSSVPVPILPTQIDVYLDSASGSIGGTKLTRVLKGEFSVTDRWKPLWTVNSAASAYAAHTEGAPKVQLKLTLEADSNGMALLTADRNGTAQYVRVVATGGTIAGTGTYLMQLDMAAKITDVGDYADEDGVYAIEWTLEPVYDSGLSKAFSVRLQNTVSAL